MRTINPARTVALVNRLSNGPHNGPYLPGPFETVKSADIPPTRARALQNRARKEANGGAREEADHGTARSVACPSSGAAGAPAC